jgi:hypothetical protein
MGNGHEISWGGIHLTNLGIYGWEPSPRGVYLPGTNTYRCPEHTGTLTAPNDMWALGCVALELCLGGLVRAPMEGDDAAIDARFGVQIRILVAGLLRTDVATRWTSEQVKRFLSQLVG